MMDNKLKIYLMFACLGLLLCLLIFLTNLRINISSKVQASKIYSGEAKFVIGNAKFVIGSESPVRKIAMDDKDKLWLASFKGNDYPRDMVVTKYDIASEAKTDFLLKGKYMDYIVGFVFDSNGQAWIATPTTLVKFDTSTGDYENFDVPPTRYRALEDLDQQTISGMVIDNDTIWMSRYNSKALTTFDIEKEKFDEIFVADDFGGADEIKLAKDGSIWMNAIVVQDRKLAGGLKIANYKDGRIEFMDYGVTGIAVSGNEVWLARSDGTEEKPSHKVTRLFEGKVSNIEFPYPISFTNPMEVSPQGDLWLVQGIDIGRLSRDKNEVEIYKVPKFRSHGYGPPPPFRPSDPRYAEELKKREGKLLDPSIKDFVFDSKGNVWFLASTFGKIGKITL